MTFATLRASHPPAALPERKNQFEAVGGVERPLREVAEELRRVADDVDDEDARAAGRVGAVAMPTVTASHGS